MMRDDTTALGTGARPERASERGGREPAWLTEFRSAARETWERGPWPEPKDPAWRYSPPELFEAGRYAAPGRGSPAGLELPPLPARSGPEAQDSDYAAVFRFLDGQPLFAEPDPIGGGAAGDMTWSLDPAALPASAARFLSGGDLKDKLRARQWAEPGPSFSLRLGPGATPDKPILVDWIESRSGAYVAPLVYLGLGEEARARITLRLRPSSQGGDALLSPTLLVDSGPGSALELFELVELSTKSRLLDYPRAILAEGASLSWGRGFFGGAAARSRLEATLEGEGSRLELREAAAAGSGQHIDLRADLRHRGRRSWSRVSIDGVADGDGAALASGLLAIERTAVGADAYLSSRHLSLSPGAKVMSMPELAIDTDDLKASHGATVGSVGDDELFYLETRGLSRGEAKALVAAGLLSRLAESGPAQLAPRIDYLAEEALRG